MRYRDAGAMLGVAVRLAAITLKEQMMIDTTGKEVQVLSVSETPMTTQTNGISIDKVMGGLHLNLTQPECSNPHG
jgi:hypothetical protein